MAAAKQNPFRTHRSPDSGALAGEAFGPTGASSIYPTFISGGIETDQDCTLVLVLERDGEAHNGATIGTAAGLPYKFTAGKERPLRVKEIKGTGAGTTAAVTGRFLF